MKYERQTTSEDLEKNGPLVEVILAPPEKIARRIQGPPPTVRLPLLIDTGAFRTAIERRKLEALRLLPLRHATAIGFSLQVEEFPVYHLAIGVRVRQGSQHATVQLHADVFGIGDMSDHHNYCGVLGRDFLRVVDFHYHGAAGRVELVLNPRHVAH